MSEQTEHPSIKRFRERAAASLINRRVRSTRKRSARLLLTLELTMSVLLKSIERTLQRSETTSCAFSRPPNP
jgi:hypothetical protein